MTTFVPTVRNARVTPATIVSGQKLSTTIDLADATYLALVIPAAFTGVVITFLGSTDPDSAFTPVKDKTGTLISLTVAPNTIVTTGAFALDLSALRFIQLQSGTNEAADRVVQVLTK